MASLLHLPTEVLSMIITFLVMSSPDTRNWAHASIVCRRMHEVATQKNILRVLNYKPKIKFYCLGQHIPVNCVLSRLVIAGNLSAQFAMAEVLLLEGEPLWKKMKENILRCSFIKFATNLPLFEKRRIANSFNTGSIADLPYIMFLSEHQPDLYESYGRLHYSRLMKAYLTMATTLDVFGMEHLLRKFIIFFVGDHKFDEYEIHVKLFNYWRYGDSTSITDKPLKMMGSERLPAGTPSYKDQLIMAFDELLRKEELSEYYM